MCKFQFASEESPRAALTSNEIVLEEVVPVSSSQSDRVHVPMCINKSRRDNIIRAVYDFGSGRRVDILCYFLDFVTGDEDIHLDALGSAILLVDHDGTSAKENSALGSHSGEKVICRVQMTFSHFACLIS